MKSSFYKPKFVQRILAMKLRKTKHKHHKNGYKTRAFIKTLALPRSRQASHIKAIKSDLKQYCENIYNIVIMHRGASVMCDQSTIIKSARHSMVRQNLAKTNLLNGVTR